MTEAQRAGILRDNARALYRLTVIRHPECGNESLSTTCTS